MIGSITFVATLLFATVNSQWKYNQELSTRSCIPGGPTPTLFASFSPCYDTPGCELPLCCGAFGDQLIDFTATYIAKQNVSGGSVTAYFTGVALTNPANDSLNLPAKLLIPALLVEKGLNVAPDICYSGLNGEFRPDFCPQTANNVYTYKGSGKPPPVVNTATVVIELQAYLHEGDKEILCFNVWGRILSPILLPILPLLTQNLVPVVG